MNKKVIVIGAGGHAKVIADIIRAAGDTFVGFLDDDPAKNSMGPVSSYILHPDCEYVIGIGNADVRERITNQLAGVKWYTAIHPTAVISPSAEIGEGTVVMPLAVINADAKVGNHCIINSTAVVEHDNVIGNYAHISVGTKLGGTVKIGSKAWVGIGAVIKNNVSVCDGCMVGAGAVVIQNITEPGTYVGVPAKKLLGR